MCLGLVLVSRVLSVKVEMKGSLDVSVVPC